MSSARQGYWNQRGDPLDWKRPRPQAGGPAWISASRAFLAADTREALAALGHLDGQDVLELGCGPGHGTLHLTRQGARLVALDLADARCRQARAHLPGGAAQFTCGDAARLPFAAASFDRLFACDVLMYTDSRAVLAESARVLRPGGRLVLVESQAGNPLLAAYRRLACPVEYRRFTHHLSWRQMIRLQSPGLRQVQMRPHHLLSLPAWFALFVLRSAALHRMLLQILEPADRLLLRSVPALASLSWRAVGVWEKLPDE